MKKSLHLFAFAVLALNAQDMVAQCAAPTSVHSFEYDGKSYEIIKENKNWVSAAACAVERGGYLAEINSEEEQNAIFTEIANAGINPDDTEAPDGGSSYVWIGGNDILEEGKWIWDGNNDAVSAQFWQGTFAGSPVGGLYNNWGDEPDNSAGGTGQDGLGLAILDWLLGDAGQWNDIKHENELYYVVEFDDIAGTDAFEQHTVAVYPNPAGNHIFVKTTVGAEKIAIVNAVGQEVRYVASLVEDTAITLDGLSAGIYFVRIQFSDGREMVKKIVKQ